MARLYNARTQKNARDSRAFFRSSAADPANTQAETAADKAVGQAQLQR